MPHPRPLPIWNPQACVPKQDVLNGTYLQAELALDLYTIAEGTAKPPYNSPETFFQATYLTETLKQILKDVLNHLAGKKVINPVLLFDAGFGGGKTHTMAAIYYAVKDPENPEIKRILEDTPIKEKVRVVVIDGSAYGGKGIKRGEHYYKTIWSDFLHQVDETELARESDTPEGLPDRKTITQILRKKPTLILIDELPKYLDLVKNNPDLLSKVKHFIHTLTLSVSEVERCILIVSVAGDVYLDAADAVRRELSEAMKILNRQMQSLSPVRPEDTPHILKKRLFDFVSLQTAKNTAEYYTHLYEQIKAPHQYRTVEYQNRIVETYPFHPELIDALYQRLSTIPEFQRTRGALRLLAHVINKMWRDREEDAFLIHPHHVDLASPEIVQELTTRLREERYVNAIASDVYAFSGKKAKAQKRDEEFNFKAPLFRRACNTIYLYTLTGAKEEAKGIDEETLIVVLATPTKEEHVQYYRDQVLRIISDSFWYIEKIGNRYVFRKEPTENRIIDQESQNVPNYKIIETIKSVIQDLYATKGKARFSIEIFPESPSNVEDSTDLKVAILNPLYYTIASEDYVPEKIAQFILNRDSKGGLRVYRNNVFLLVAGEGSWENLRDMVARLEVAKALAEDPEKYGIPHEKKKNLKQKELEYLNSVNSFVRASFAYIVYIKKGGKVEAKHFRPNGYGTAQPGQEVLWHILSNILQRVTSEPLEPEYVKLEAWPSGAVETTTQGLYENLHKKPGVILPENRSLFEKIIIEGVKKGTWVLVQHGEVYTPERPPSQAIISSNAILLLPEEAGKRNLTDPRGHLCPNCRSWPCKCSKPRESKIEPTIKPETKVYPEYETFEPMSPKLQLEDLERWVKREEIEEVTEAEITLVGSSDMAIQFKNLIRLLRAGKKASTKVKVEAGTYHDNRLKLNVTLEANDEGLDAPPTKILDELAKLSLPEFKGTINIKTESLPIDELKQLLKEIANAKDPNIKLGLRLKPKREK